ncbi:MAG TPA: endonuclease III [Patescibacteria group bacterium]|nr:endonuclease III [Patescibacteria group bacterium]
MALDALERRFGRPRRDRKFGPLEELVLTVLSQNTNDTNRDRAYASLTARFPAWHLAARAPVRAIESAIRTGGLARTKSRVIRALLRRIEAERHGFDLGFLRDLPLDEARAWLRSFRGVGDKTAACVLLFSCHRPAFPVDTHILRVTRRLGWIAGKATAAEAHLRLATLIPERRYFEAHVNLITLGRRLCKPRKPLCAECPLSRSCPTARREVS